MPLFTGQVSGGYAQRHMPQPIVSDGPWGEAIRYWLQRKNLSQQDVARMTKMPGNTVSRAARGFHVQTRVLGRIARALDVPLTDVLVSPVRRAMNEDRRRFVADVTEQVVRKLESPELLVTEQADIDRLKHEIGQATTAEETRERERQTGSQKRPPKKKIKK